MPLPAGVEKVTVSSGEPLTLPDGTPIQGRLIFTGPSVLTIAEDNLIAGGPVEVPLVAGAFTAQLLATDATGMSPTGWTYKVQAILSNAPGWTRYLTLPKATPSVILADVLVPDPVAGTFTVLVDGSALLAKTSNLADLPNPGTARGNLGLGDAATRNVGSTAGTVAAGDDSRLSDSRAPTAHAASHASGGTDPVSPAAIGAATTAAVSALSSDVSNLDTFVGDCLVRVQNIEQGNAFLAGGHYTGPVDIASNGLAAVRIMGRRTTAGAPTAGTWAAGDTVQDSAGTWWLCTVAGSPGTWVAGTFLPLTGGTLTGGLTVNTAAEANALLALHVGAETFDRVRVTTDRIEVGSGSAARDTNWRRSAANEWTTDDAVIVSLMLRHLGTTLGFYGATATTKPVVTGSRGGNAALASLLTALATLGLVTDSTTA
ncbi:hypothetical protein ACWCQZ_08375 [Streptomyces sp. NPDC002285]